MIAPVKKWDLNTRFNLATGKFSSIYKTAVHSLRRDLILPFVLFSNRPTTARVLEGPISIRKSAMGEVQQLQQTEQLFGQSSMPRLPNGEGPSKKTRSESNEGYSAAFPAVAGCSKDLTDQPMRPHLEER